MSRENLAVLILYTAYIGLVLFCCFYDFSSEELELDKYFLGIRMDRYVHFTMFFPYPFSCWLVLKTNRRHKFLQKNALLISAVTGLFFAAATEVSQQYLFKPRSGDILDFAADSAGILLATVLIPLAFKPVVVRFLKIND